MSDLKDLTRASLEAAYKMQHKRLMAETMKNEVVVDRLKEIITVVHALIMPNPSRINITGRIKALITWLGQKSQFQFEYEIKDKTFVLRTFENWRYFGVGLCLGMTSFLIIVVIVGMIQRGM